jgi:tetratricopeptide (TPR) repeat protein
LALAACAGASPEDQQMAQALSAQGKKLLASGKTAEALDMYASALNRDDENAQAWDGLGVANDLLGKRAEAEDAYKNAVDLDPDDATAVNNLAHLYLEKGDPDAAVQLLQPYANTLKTPPTLRQNLTAATKALRVKQEKTGDVYADLGASPTEGMAQGRLAEVRHILDDDAEGLSFAIVPEVKTGGGIPVFTLRATGDDPRSICETLNAEAFPCIPHGKR